jgi:thiol-disulfide isomerase/thioredoxin
MSARLNTSFRKFCLTGLACGMTALASQAAGAALDFELSDGQHFVRLADLPPRVTVVNFWRTDCPPCVRELPVLAEFARRGQARIITIALQRPAETTAAPEVVQTALQAPLTQLHGPSEPRGLLARFGDRSGALPHTVVLDAERRPCAQRSGEINAAWLTAALGNCPAP